MVASVDPPRILVTGATGFLGYRVVAALLAADLPVTVLVRREGRDKLSALSGQLTLVDGDEWNRGSLKGQARRQHVVVHLVGSLHSDPKRGLTYQQINLVSARNIIGMAVSDGVPHFVLLSVATLPGMLPADYVRSKRDAEEYLQNSGLQWTVLRLPPLYLPSQKRPLLTGISTFGALPPLRWVVGRYMPLNVAVAGQGIAALSQDADAYAGQFVYANDIRRLARQLTPTRTMMSTPVIARRTEADDNLDDTPFGWAPPSAGKRPYRDD